MKGMRLHNPQRVALTLLLAAALLAGPALTGMPGAAAQGGGQPDDLLAQSGGGTLYFTPTPAYVDVGGTVTVSLCMAGVENLYGLDFHFSYDETLVNPAPAYGTLTYANPGIFLPGTFFQLFNNVNTTPAPDEIWIAASKLNPTEPFTGAACVGTIQFTGLAAGVTPLHFTYSKASDRDGRELDPKMVAVDGLIVVGDAADLALAKTADFRTTDPYYRLTVTNSGPHDAVSPTLVDSVPPEALLGAPLVYTSRLTTSSGTVDQGTCSAVGQTVTCDLGVALPDTASDPAARWVVEIHVTDSTTTGTALSNTASVSSTTLDAVLGNNTVTYNTTTPARIIKFVPTASTVYVGNTVTVDICLEDVVDIYGLSFNFDFMKALVSVPSTPVTSLWGVFHPLYHLITYNRVNTVDATYDQVEYVVTNLNPAAPFTGSGCVGSITFTGLAVGTTPLDFVYVKASNRDAEERPLNWVDGSITVQYNPTAVAISRFVARPMGRSVRVLWSTEQETSILGFNLYRSEDRAGDPLRLNDTLIPGKATGSPAGAQYQFADRSVEPGVLYHYWLESVGVDGAATRLGPESAAAAQFLLDPPVQ